MPKRIVEPVQAEDVFYCRPKRRRLTVQTCLDDFVTANAFGDRRSVCHECPQGHEVRTCFGWSDPLPKRGGKE